MFEDILGKKKSVNMNSGSKGDTKPQSFSEVWAEKQRQIKDAQDYDFEEDEYENEYEGLQV